MLRPADRFNLWLVLVLAAAGVYACATTLPLIWDGAYQFNETLVHGRAYTYQGRVHTWPLWQPVLLAARVTDNPRVLVAVYGAPFLLAPAAAALSAWWVVRRHAPGLMLWVLFGVAVGPLPGQVFAISDSVLMQHLFWPVFVGLFVPLTRPQKAVLAAMAAFQLTQPTGVAYAVGAAAAALLVGVVHRPLRRRQAVRAGVMLLLAAAGVAKVLLVGDSQVGLEADRATLWLRWHNGVTGLPLAGMACFWAAAAAAFVGRATRSPVKAGATGRGAPRPVPPPSPAPVSACRDLWHPSVMLNALAVASALAGLSLWLGWAADEHHWRLALDYRRYVLPLSLPFFLAAAIEACRSARRSSPADVPPEPPSPSALPVLLAATFAAVLGVQSTLWYAVARRLRADVNAYPAVIVPASAVAWAYGTALDHWSAPAVYAALEGPVQRRILVLDDRHYLAPETGVPMCAFARLPYEPGPFGFYDVRAVESAVRAAEARERAADQRP